MEEEQRKQANLRMLQRYGPWTEIIATATHVVLYEFKTESGGGGGGAWCKAGKEGTLFLASPPATLIILNRTSTENFILNITGAIQIQHEQGFVILRVESVIYGLWFPSADERSRMFDMVAETIMALRNQRPRAVSAPRASNMAPPPLPPTPSSLAEVGKLKAALGIGGAPPTNNSANTPVQPMGATMATTITAIPAEQFTPVAAPSSVLPGALAAAAAAAATGPGITEPLDKRSLQLALLSLVQDERFLDLIHTQYLRVVQRRQDKNGGN
jgi:mRNA-decapping enzyme 1B